MDQPISHEELYEALVTLETKREGEQKLHRQVEALLSGVQALIGSLESGQVFEELFKVLLTIIPYHSAFILMETGGEFTPIAATHEYLLSTKWTKDRLFNRVLGGETVPTFNVNLVSEWKSQPTEIREAVNSALHVPIIRQRNTAILILTHTDRFFFTTDHIKLISRFSPLAIQALVHAEIKKTQLEQARLLSIAMEKELELGKAVQSILVPESNKLIQLNGLTISGFFKPTNHCGGDWWNYFSLPNGDTLLLIGDVVGHGIAAALVSASLTTSPAWIIESSGNRIDLLNLLTLMNKVTFSLYKGKFPMTCFAILYCPEKNSISYVNAGHAFPFYYKSREKKISSLCSHGTLLGIKQFEIQAMEYPSVEKNDLILLYTDGILDCFSGPEKSNGERKLRHFFSKKTELPLEEISSSLSTHIVDYFSSNEQSDDITFIFGKFQ